jgi:hypothetical protein
VGGWKFRAREEEGERGIELWDMLGGNLVFLMIFLVWINTLFRPFLYFTLTKTFAVALIRRISRAWLEPVRVSLRGFDQVLGLCSRMR